ncbi:hypothetical protein B0H17DRAFT_1091199 [Mycena rosella]|uniref:Uncharacterized protein n=1 Tax=Mycena rosella TaxID=1033263 RepID=A0AAD7G3Y0_MYCRO|nr:hypothetical protein B0H17DRAFT_1091199 [Mycena rosella]
MDYTVSATSFADVWTFASADLFEAISEVLFYGILLVLVAFALNLLSQRKAAGGLVLGIATVIMFILATVQLAARLQATVEAVKLVYLTVQGQTEPQTRISNETMDRYINFNFAEDVLLVTNNMVTDGVLIYRCFLIWGRNKYVVIGPGLLLLITSVLSYLSAVQGDYPTPGGPTVDLRIGFLLSVLTNLLLVGLTAGRVWHTRHKARGFLKKEVARRYNTAVIMILESGAILCAWTVAYVVFRSISPPTVWRVFRGGLAQILNIVPTLIVVRVGLGHTVDEANGTWRSKDSSLAELKSQTETSASSQV